MLRASNSRVTLQSSSRSTFVGGVAHHHQVRQPLVVRKTLRLTESSAPSTSPAGLNQIRLFSTHTSSILTKTTPNASRSILTCNKLVSMNQNNNLYGRNLLMTRTHEPFARFTLPTEKTLSLRLYSHQTHGDQHSSSASSGAISPEALAETAIQTVSASDKAIAWWLLLLCFMVFLMIILGGVTRLTESGLSITEWKPIVGAVPPRTDEEWEIEFNKYKASPEYIKLKQGLSMEDFKFTYYMEWGHRQWGRIIGMAYLLPYLYFLSTGKVKSPQLKKRLGVIFALGGLQGALGWYMVKSGLEVDKDNGDIPRVSPYRLASHLGAAFALYGAMFWTALSLLKPNPNKAQVPKLRSASVGVLHLAAMTIMSGAFVAGLDAGLVYNEFPYMGEHIHPPKEELLRLNPKWKNFFENDVAVQFTHRTLAITTLTAIIGTWLASRKHKGILPTSTKRAFNTTLGVGLTQASLGIATLLYFVPTQLAAAHQAGAVTLFTSALWLAHEMRRPKKLIAAANAAAKQAVTVAK